MVLLDYTVPYGYKTKHEGKEEGWARLRDLRCLDRRA
jgi:hypothetical protein